MTLFGENGRFWLPVLFLALITVVSTRKVVLSHINPDVSVPDYYFTRELKGCRGSIYDSFGKSYPLVKSVPYWEYHLDPVALTNAIVKPGAKEPRRTKEAIVKTISTALKLDYATVLKMSDNVKKRYQYLAMSADTAAHRILANSKYVAGVVIEEKQVRQYLHGRRLSHVVGYVNGDHVGSAGIEQRYNRELTGVPGKIRGMKDAHGHELYDKRIVSIQPIAGADIYLTVDHNIQYETETALAWGLKEFSAGSGWCIVLDAETGAVLAMASLPDFDPVTYRKSDPRAIMNRTTGFNYEPGSAMKVITAAAGIDCGIVSPGTTYNTRRDDPNYFRLPGDGSHVWDPRMTVSDAVVHSSNIVIGKLGCDLGPKRLWGYMRAFGFGEKTGIELPGEERGILPHWRDWDKVKWSRAPIGQGVGVTAIQMASAYQAIANNGRRMKPYIVSKIVGADGKELFVQSPTLAGTPIKASTARQMRNIMTGVASAQGTARRAAIRGYSVAGKTGTAQKVINGHYSDSLYRATFCGIVPASDPKIVVLVTLDFDQRTKYHQGGNSSAPVFKRIATAALRYLMISPDKPEEIDEFDDEDEFDKVLEERAEKMADRQT